MKRGKQIKINLTNNWNETESVNAEFLGEGMFAKCYLYEGRVYSFVNTSFHHNDLSKELISAYADETNPHIPQIESKGSYDNGLNDYGTLFTMPYYETLSAKHKQAWNQYKVLKSHYSYFKDSGDSWYDNNIKFINSLRGKIDESIIEALQSINEVCTSDSLDYAFEFPKCNLKVDSNGNLILLDVICNTKAVKERRNKNKR